MKTKYASLLLCLGAFSQHAAAGVISFDGSFTSKCDYAVSSSGQGVTCVQDNAFAGTNYDPNVDFDPGVSSATNNTFSGTAPDGDAFTNQIAFTQFGTPDIDTSANTAGLLALNPFSQPLSEFGFSFFQNNYIDWTVRTDGGSSVLGFSQEFGRSENASNGDVTTFSYFRSINWNGFDNPTGFGDVSNITTAELIAYLAAAQGPGAIWTVRELGLTQTLRSVNNTNQVLSAAGSLYSGRAQLVSGTLAVHEPSTLVLLFVGLLSTLLARFRRRQV